MRGGVRLPALVVVIGLLAGCSDPPGAVRRQRAGAARRHASASPSPGRSLPARRPARRTAGWWQVPGTVKTAGGLRVHTGTLRGGRLKVALTDVRGHVSRTVVVLRVPRRAVVGHF